jgi:hypothetical protein
VVMRRVPYQVIDRFTVDASWDGAPKTLLTSQNANIPQTPNGTMVLAYQNVGRGNNLGTISITSGGGNPSFHNAPALTNQPSILIDNWQANNLSVTNVSTNADTPIRIQAIGPGIPGTNPIALPIGPPGVVLANGQTAQGNASPQWMQLVISCPASTLAILALIGGPSDSSGNNGYVFAVNCSANTGPGGPSPPEGYYATTTSNTYAFQFNFGSSVVFVANMSSLNAAPLNVLMRAL